ncbi:MAG: DUF4091 domain-containing protein [Clostridia bacterium]|nr:DUF4091 domain-containing protein [Clostridia bacterium]
MKREDFKFIQLSSLEKVFLDEAPKAKEFEKISVLKNERFSYQIAYVYDKLADRDACKFDFKVSVDSPLKDYVKIRFVGNVPVELTHYHHGQDDAYLRKRPGLFPDSLLEIKSGEIEIIPKLWHSLWITVDTKGEMPAGNYNIDVVFEGADVRVVKTLSVKVLEASLPKQETIVANWFHTDCLASLYKVKMYSKKHWQIIENFMKCAIENGVNSIYTPIFSIPLDTNPGVKRPACQLVDITVTDGEYTLDFTKLRKWISIFKKYGGSYLAMSHLFSQWGAKFAPRIVATVNGKKKEIFGWHTPNNSPEYKKFLDKCIPALIEVLKEEGVADKVYFHISDEPHVETLDSYNVSKSVVADLIKDFKIVEACSVPEIHQSGAVDYPVVHLPNVDAYLEKGITPFGAYFCCSSDFEYFCNRFIDMPSFRNRIIGIQMFKYNITMLLHFGFNYYFKRAALGGTAEVINPFFATDAGNAIQGGNGFVVYPGEGGKPVDSLRLDVTFNAVQDISAMKLLASYIGHDEVVKLIEDYAGMEIKMNRYPMNAEFILGLREKINEKIEEVAK